MNLPFPEYGKTTEETIRNLMDTVVKLRKELEYALHNIDASDINDLIFPEGYTDAEALAAWAASNYATHITSEGVYTGTVAANQIIVGTAEGYLALSQIADAGVLAALDTISASYVTDLGSLATLNTITLAKVTDSGALAALNSVTSTYIGDGAVITAKIATGAVLADKIAANAVTADKISVTSLSAIEATLGTVNSGSITSTEFCTNTLSAYPRLDIGYYSLSAILFEADSADYGSISVNTSGVMIIDCTDEIRLYNDYCTRYDYNGVFSQIPAANSGQTIKFQTSGGRLEHSTNGGSFVVLANYADLSDQAEKQDIGVIENELLDAVDQIDIIKFKYNKEVSQSGDGAKTHFGVVSQNVRDVLLEKGLPIEAFEFLTKYEKSELPTIEPEEFIDPGLKGESKIKPKKKKELPVPSDVQAIVYTELHSLQIAALKRKVKQLEDKILTLEASNG